jgi:hypothetical protein
VCGLWFLLSTIIKKLERSRLLN